MKVFTAYRGAKPKLEKAEEAGKSSPLDFPSEKSFLFFFAHEKGLRHMFHKPKNDFWLDQRSKVDSDRKCEFHRFCLAHSDCNNVAHGIPSCYKLQHVFSWHTDKIWKLHLKYFSCQRDQRRPFSSTLIWISTLIWVSKIRLFVQKNSQNAGVNRAKKACQWIAYRPMMLPIASNPRLYL